jgi:hypothetical protein
MSKFGFPWQTRIATAPFDSFDSFLSAAAAEVPIPTVCADHDKTAQAWRCHSGLDAAVEAVVTPVQKEHQELRKAPSITHKARVRVIVDHQNVGFFLHSLAAFLTLLQNVPDGQALVLARFFAL